MRVKLYPDQRFSSRETGLRQTVHKAKVAALLITLALLDPMHAGGEKAEQLKPQGYVNDFANVLTSYGERRLNSLCDEVDRKAHAQLAVVTIKTLEGVPIEDFANDLFQRWGIGPKSENRGVLILLAVGDHRYRVEVGYGLEPILPDGKVGGFGREMLPLLRQGNYDAALLQLTGEITNTIGADRGVTIGTPPQRQSGWRIQHDIGGIPVVVLIVLAFLLFGGFGLISPLIAIFWGRDYYRRRGWYGGWWGGPGMGGFGGGWSGGGFGGGSSGGFGGFGGGSSGGGGASGSW